MRGKSDVGFLVVPGVRASRLSHAFFFVLSCHLSSFGFLVLCIARFCIPFFFFFFYLI